MTLLSPLTESSIFGFSPLLISLIMLLPKLMSSCLTSEELILGESTFFLISCSCCCFSLLLILILIFGSFCQFGFCFHISFEAGHLVNCSLDIFFLNHVL